MKIYCWLVCIGMAALAGCGKPAGRFLPASGTVTLEGVPLDQGSIQFIPADPPGQVAGGAMIRDGRFQLSAEHGLRVGRYQVQISSVESESLGDPIAAMQSRQPHQTKQRIPPAYNQESQVFVEVRSDALNQFDIAIP